MQNVTAFEARLMRLLYYFLRREPPVRALPLVEASIGPPRCLSRVTSSSICPHISFEAKTPLGVVPAS